MIGWIIVVGFLVLLYLQFKTDSPSGTSSAGENITMDDVYIYATLDDEPPD